MTHPAPVETAAAAICIVRDKDGRVLTVARHEEPHEYSIPGGTINEGETPEACARREVFEETGVTVGPLYCASEYIEAEKRWANLVLTSPEDGATRVHVFCSWCWTGVPRDAEGPLDATGAAKPAVTWLTPPELLAQADKFKASVERILKSGNLNSQWNMADKVLADLSPSDVHVPGAMGSKKKVKLAELPAAKRNALDASKFAWPEQRKFPIQNAAHVRAAASRLAGEVNAGRISKATAAKIHSRIVAAGKKLGVEVESKDGLPAQVKSASPMKRRGVVGQRGRLDVTIDHPQHGRIDIRHLTLKDWDALDGRAELADSGSVLLYARKDIQLSANEDDSPTWNQISTRGTFAGHGAGVFSLDDSVFNDIIRNYREVDGGKVAFDFEHASEQDAATGTIPVTGCPAQGWILDLRSEPDGLHALVDWLEPAKSYIRERKYQFVSPAIRFGARHPVTGKNIGARLTSTACTNQPFLRGLQSLAAKDTVASTHGKPRRMTAPKTLAHSPAEFMPKIKACLDMHELSTPADVAEKMKALREMHASANADGMSGGVDVGSYCDKLRDEMQAPVGSTVEDIFDAVDAMIEAASEEHEAAMQTQSSAVRADGDDAATMSARAAEETQMAESIALKDVTTKLTQAEAKIAEISLELKDRDVKVTTLQTENARLLKEGTDRDAAVLEDRVQDAFETHKDAKKLTVEAFDMMRTYCMTNRAGFDKLYPVLRGPKKYLMRDLAGANGGTGKDIALTTDAGANPPATGAVVQVNGKPFTLGANANATTLLLRDNDPTLSFDDAQIMALKFHSGR
jgi:8-oxo-dGTP pyrophosphatase MutT (NUDIX family)/phage I-like protein